MYSQQLLANLWRHLSLKRKYQLSILIILNFLNGLAEIFALGSVIPFLSALINPSKLLENKYTSIFLSSLSITSDKDIITISTCAFLGAYLASTLIRALNVYANVNVAASIGCDLGRSVFQTIISRPYPEHLKNNSSKDITSATFYIDKATGWLNAVLQLISAFFSAFYIIIALFLIEWKAAISAILLFSFVYMSIAKVTKQVLIRNGSFVTSALSDEVKVMQEALGSIRDVILDNNHSFYISKFSSIDAALKRKQAQSIFLSNSPRYYIEFFGIVIITLISLILLAQGPDKSKVLPVVGALALGSQRLLPILQQVFNNWSATNSLQSSLAVVLDILSEKHKFPSANVKPISTFTSLVLTNIYYQPAQDQPAIFDSLSLHIRSGDKIGIMGVTGSGKSTLMDIMMGLISPQKGSVLVNNSEIHKQGCHEIVSRWQSSISHVPQNLFLVDSSIAENIALGVPLDEIDFPRLNEASKIACIADFICSLPEQYMTKVGERGAMLSGGQIQRIGIARAIYKKASVIFLDEATSALDSRTQTSIMEAIANYNPSITIVSIAHRAQALAQCNKIFRLENRVMVRIK